jgi:signal recognition particle subunit SRP54
MTETERLQPTIMNDSRMSRVAKGSGYKQNDVKELMGKFGMMQQMMGSIGSNPGLLGRIPGFKQLGQLAQMKGMDMGQVFGKDAKMMEQAMAGMGMGGGPGQMQMPQLAPGYTAPVGSGAMTRARMMGYSPEVQGKPVSDRERDAIKERRKREKANKKKNRKKR